MESYRAQIRHVLEAIHIDLPNRFRWFGMPSQQSVLRPGSPLSDEQHLDLLCLNLQGHLYHHFYCPGTAVPHAANWEVTSVAADAGTFASELSQANLGRGYWDPGWHVEEVASTALGLRKHNLAVVAPAEDCLGSRGRELAKGESVLLRSPKGSFHRSPGFYLAYGDEVLHEVAADALVRIYWNVDSTGAHVLMRAVTDRLNRVALPFLLKVLDDPRNYGRCDSAVLYIAKETYALFRTDHAKPVLSALSHHLANAVPALTKRVATGVGVAEDPAEMRSFGLHRCGVLARALVTSIGRDVTLNEKLDLVETYFQRSGIDLELPYLNAHSSDEYEAFERPIAGSPRDATRLDRAPPELSHDELLDAACDIGALMVSTALWHEDTCNWTGTLGPVSEASHTMRFGTLGTDLYDGTSGIALFLGELFGVTGDERVRRTALGAIEHALAIRAETTAEHLGFYIGSLGTATAAARLGRLLDRRDLTERARSLARNSPDGDIGFDVLSGAAGCILGYLVLHQLIEDDDLMEAARAMGNLLVNSAERSGDGVSWSSEQIPGTRNLTGFSHGAAGAAYALLELFVVSGQEDFKRTAEAAMAYERSWFDQREKNWPDFRQVTQERSAEATRLSYSTTWCHGAPGIAVSRIRAAEIISDRCYREEASVALNTTRDHLRDWLSSGRPNYSLCHGAAGNADVLLTGLHSDAELEFDPGGVIQDTARVGLRAYGVTGAPWPCGVGGGGSNPSLMLGLAGIGHFLLRMAREDVPSVLAPLNGRGMSRP